MLLGTSWAPVSQTWTLFSDIPNREFNIRNNTKIGRDGLGRVTPKLSSILSSVSCNSTSPNISSLSEVKLKSGRKVFSRALSDSSLEGLASNSHELEELFFSRMSGDGCSSEQHSLMLHTEPSFCIYNKDDGEEEVIGNEDLAAKMLAGRDGIADLGSPKFSFGKNAMASIEEDADEEDRKEETLGEFKDLGIEGEAISSPWPLAGGRGGIDDGVDGGTLDSGLPRFDENGDVEEHYKRMIKEDPSNPLFLRNYAQFLKSKGELSGAEECYFRATLADPKDGEIMLQYAKLVWELHNDKDKALKYFKKAACAAPEDSHVLAAYASFLWELDEDEDEVESSSSNEQRQVEEFGGQMDQCHSEFAEDQRPASPPLHLATGLGIDMAGFGGTMGYADCMKVDFSDSINVEEYYRRMIEENPSNPLFLRNYAQYLCETQGDLQAAEEYYLRAMHLDPSDGEITLQYAKVIWELRQDRHEALPFFKQAVQAAPQNSDVLAAYASFLWETEEDEEEDLGLRENDHVAVPHGTVICVLTEKRK
nr:uncharacterized protein LOC113734360 [Coffea arabica]